MIKKTMREVFDTCLPLVWYPFYFTILAIRPIIKLRIGCLVNDRIGHMIGNLEYHLRRESTNRPASRKSIPPYLLDIFVTTRYSANNAVKKLISRRIIVISSDILWRFYDAARRRWPDAAFWIDTSSTGAHDFDIWEKTEPKLLSLNQSEIEKGNSFLQNLGISPSDPFVCFAVRDQAYLEEFRPHTDKARWRVHDYRDARIEHFLPMAEWVTSQGIPIFRMGAKVDAPLVGSSPLLIDYATNHRTEFLDIFLSARCAMFVGDTAGSFWMPLAFENPIAQANILPLSYPGRGRETVFIPKKFTRLEDGEYISYREIVYMGADNIYTSDGYEKLGLGLEENSADEILEMAKERFSRANGSWSDCAENRHLQDRFWSIFPKGHCVHGSPALISEHFMIKHHELF
jgi:putative glycosyltransferase (TIGR04372 family)